ncbi:MAG: helix-turn-helix domain-containing protein [Planctomycetes bacterium]|nr:helix-turn-helix domain-containing protein [Planctomycetota bacterium]
MRNGTTNGTTAIPDGTKWHEPHPDGSCGCPSKWILDGDRCVNPHCPGKQPKPTDAVCPPPERFEWDGTVAPEPAPPAPAKRRPVPTVEPGAARSSDLFAAFVTEIRTAVRQELQPLRQELAKLRGEDEPAGVTMSEAARRLGVSIATIQRRVIDGTLPSKKIGRVRRVLLSAILPGT